MKSPGIKQGHKSVLPILKQPKHFTKLNLRPKYFLKLTSLQLVKGLGCFIIGGLQPISRDTDNNATKLLVDEQKGAN